MISNSIQLLVQDLDAACDPALTAMSKVAEGRPTRHTDTHTNPTHTECHKGGLSAIRVNTACLGTRGVGWFDLHLLLLLLLLTVCGQMLVSRMADTTLERNVNLFV